MSWLTRVRERLPFAPKRETSDNLWIKCPRCQEMVFAQEYEANLSVCPNCEHHGRIGADARLAQLLDEGFELLPAPQVAEEARPAEEAVAPVEAVAAPAEKAAAPAEEAAAPAEEAAATE